MHRRQGAQSSTTRMRTEVLAFAITALWCLVSQETAAEKARWRQDAIRDTSILVHFGLQRRNYCLFLPDNVDPTILARDREGPIRLAGMYTSEKIVAPCPNV
jgi:hypothetical protein